MSHLNVNLSEELYARLRGIAEHQRISLDDAVVSAIELFVESEEPTKADILQGIREGLQDAIAGRVRSAKVVLDELENE